MSQELHELPALFCELHDALDEARFRRCSASWLDDPSFDSAVGQIARELEGGAPPARLRMRIDNDDSDRMPLACLIALDIAFGHLRPRSAQRIPPGMARLAAHVEMTGRLDAGAHGGALLPRVAVRPSSGQAPDHIRDLFTNVIRVPERSWRMASFQVLGGAERLQRPEVQGGFQVACAPLIADPAELDFRALRRGQRRVYQIAPAGLAVTRARIAKVVDAMHASGATVGLAPEITLSRELLTCWQRALRRWDRSRGSTRLLWVLVGSGNVDGCDPPTNTAMLLDARSGAIVARQDKLFPFNLDSATLARWKLADRLGSDPLDEDLRRGELLTVLEAGGGVRLAMLVCEDAGRALDLGPVVRDFGVSHLLVPVFSRPLKPHRWEQDAAVMHLRETGSTIVVANSLAMHSILGEDGGTALAVWPGSRDAAIDRCDDPAQVVCFTLHRDGTVALS